MVRRIRMGVRIGLWKRWRGSGIRKEARQRFIGWGKKSRGVAGAASVKKQEKVYEVMIQ